MGRPENNISRRQFLQLLALGFGASALGIGVGGVVEDNFLLKDNNDELLALARFHMVAGNLQAPEIGSLVDFGNETGKFPDLQKIKERLVETNRELGTAQSHIGIFARMDEFENPVWVENFLTQLKFIYEEMDATPVIGMHTGYPPGFPLAYPHPFAKESRQWLETQMNTVVAALKKLHFKMKIRVFYEMNTKKSFVYSPVGWNVTLSEAAQQQGFIEAFRQFDQILKREKVREQFSLIYCPMAQADLSVSSHFPGKDIVDEGAIDVYDYGVYPSAEVLGRRVSLKASPESFIPAALNSLSQLMEADELVIEEIGSRTQDVAWLEHAVSLAFSLKVQRIMHFDFDKSQLKEWDFSLNPETLRAYRKILNNFK